MMNKRLLISLIIGIPSIFGISRKPEETKVEPISSSFPDFKFELKDAVSSSADFMQAGEQKQTLTDLLKNYLKTTTGAKDFANLLTSSFLVEFIDDFSSAKASALMDKLKNELILMRSNSFIGNLASELKNEKLKDFGFDAAAYQDYYVLQQIRGKFLEVISPFFKSAIGASQSDLKGENNSDEALTNLGDFLDHSLDDYIKFEKPLFVKKITWKYDTSSVHKSKIKELFGEEDLPANFEFPDRGSYFFPIFTSETETKFQNFVGSLSTATATDYSQYSDVSHTNYVFSVTEATNPANTSQFSVALLELFAHALTYEQWGTGGTGTINSNLSQQAQQETLNICGQQGGQEKGIPSLKSQSLKNKLSEIFCVSKDNSPYKTQKPLSDFFYLKQQQQQQKANNWIVFKDFDGVHAMGIDTSVSVEVQEVKKKLLQIAQSSSASDYQWDFSYLSRHIENHFARLFLGKWNETYKKLTTTTTTQEAKWDLLVDVLKADALSDLIKKLRINLLKDYLTLLEKRPVRARGQIKSFNPSLGWAGAFPYKMFQKNLSISNSKWKGEDMVFDFLETTFLAQYKKLSGSTLSVEGEYKDTIKKTIEQYRIGIDGFFNLFSNYWEQSNKTQEDENYFSIKTKQTNATWPKYLSPYRFMQNLWTFILQDSKVLDLLVQDKLKDKLKDKLSIYIWQSLEPKWNESGNVSGVDKNLFDEAADEAAKTLMKQYLWQKHLDKFISSAHPLIFGSASSDTTDLTTTDLTTTDKAIKILQSFENHDNVVISSIKEDLINPSNRDLFYDLLAIKYLSENNLDRLRLFLKNKISKDNFSAFVFSRKWEGESFCEILEDRPSDSSASVFEYNSEYAWELKNKILGYDDADFKDFKKCVPKEELFNFAKAKLPKDDGTKGSSFKHLVGYKGLVSSDINNLFPEEIVSELVSKNVLWKDREALLNYVDSISAEDKYKELVEKLKKLFPSVDWRIADQDQLIENRNFNFSWDADAAQEIYANPTKLTLEDKKKILKGYLAQQDINTFDIHGSLGYLREVQEKFLSQKEIEKENYLLPEDKFKSFYNLVTDKSGSHILVDSKGNKYVIFLIQIKYDDVVDANSWKSYMKTVSDDLIIKELVKAAKDKNVQQEAVYHYLNEASGDDQIEKFVFFDSRLKKQFDVQWQKPIV